MNRFTSHTLILAIALTLGSLQAFAQAEPSSATSESSSAGTGDIIAREIMALPGDTFARIARREMGSAAYASPIAEFNNMRVGSRIKADQPIRLPIHVPSRGESALVVFLKGEVLRGGLPIPRNDAIYSGDTITTGIDGFISIEFSNGTIVNLQPDSEVTLNRLNCLPGDDSCFIDIKAGSGSVSSDVDTRTDQSTEYRITTPYASAAVRGTIFETVVASRELRVGVTEGSIVISALEQDVDIDTGFGSVTREGEAPGAAIPLLPPPVFQNVPSRVADGDTLTWWALTGVQNYASVLSLDSEAVQSVLGFEASTNRLDITTADSGVYYLTVRGIDDNGIPGYSSTTRVTVAEVDPDAPAVETQVSREGQEFLVEVIDPPDYAAGFEIQISETPDFSDPLSVDVSGDGAAVFRIVADTVFSRARLLLDPLTVSSFGEPSSNR